MHTKWKFLERNKQLREDAERGLSTKELAVKYNITRQRVYMILRPDPRTSIQPYNLEEPAQNVKQD